MRAVIPVLLFLLFLLPASISASPLFEETPQQAETPSPHGQTQPEQTQSAGQRLMIWLINQQRTLHRQLAEGIEQLRDSPTVTSAGALILISFLYGVFHATGPGHGKAVITTYLLTQRQHLRRGILMSFAAALLQGLTAIITVSLILFVAGHAASEALGQTATLEQISFTLVSLLGLWLTFRSISSLWRLRRIRSNPDEDPLCAEHNHHIDPHTATEGRATVAATVMAVGARPCTGAILVLTVGHLMGIWTAGVAAVIAMSLGTGLTVAVLASLAVLAREWVSGYARGKTPKLEAIAHTFALLGGVLILSVGLVLLTGSFTIPTRVHPLGLSG